jgi:PAS domain S-box-containing protein
MSPSQNANHFQENVLEQTRLALAETQALYRVARSLIAFPNLPALLQTVVNTVAEALHANRVALITFDLETQNVTNFIKGGTGEGYVFEVSFEELWDGLSGWTLRERKPALSSKAVPDPRESLEVRRRRLETNCGSIIVVPLYHRSHVLGTITAINCPDEREFTDRDVELMMAMASQCAVAIENARLLEQLQSTNSDLEHHVAERTSKLAETNARLQAEIAEHDRMAQALQVSEARYRGLVETMNDGLAVVDENTVLTYVNRRFCDLLAYTQDEMVGRPLPSFLDAANREIFYEHLARRRKGEQSLYEINWTTKDGNKIDTLISGTPLLGDQGEFRGSFAVITDITERKQMEQVLRESEARYRSIVTAMAEGIVVQNSSGAVETWNAAAETILGLAGKQMGGSVSIDSSWRTIHEDGSPFPVEAHPGMMTLQTGKPQRNIIMGIQKQDGMLTWISINSEPLIRPSENRPYAVVSSFSDITVNKQSEVALQQSEEHARGFQEKLKALQEISLELAAVGSLEQLCQRAIELGLSSLGYDRIGLLLFENADRTRISLFGLESSGELRVEHGVSYKPAADPAYSHLHHREDVFVSEDADLRDFDKVVGRGWNVVVGIWDANARIGWLAADNLFNKHPLLPYEIELLKLYGLTLGHLVTRKRAEESLRRYNQRLATFHEIDRSILVASSLESIADIVLKHLAQLIPCEFASVILHNEELTEELVFAWNHAPDVHVLTKTIQPVVPNQVLERLKSGRSAVTADLIAQEGPLALLAEELVAQGVHAAMANPMMVQGQLIGTLAFASRQVGFFTPEHQQIGEELADQVAIAFHQAKLHAQIESQNIELEQRVRDRTTQLENANRELELFSYSISHDLRTPLRAIQGFAEIIGRRHKKDLNDEGRHYFDNIIMASEQMDQLISDLLDYVRLGRQRVRLTTIPLGNVISEVLNNLMPQIVKTNAQILVNDLPDILGDLTLLKRIFTNLLENALVYHRPGVPPLISIDYVLEADFSVIHISDNGIGIPHEFRHKIFDIFQRLHSQTEYPGTGIGLAIVRKSVEMLKGSVWVEAASQAGSVFCVKLPHRAKKG